MAFNQLEAIEDAGRAAAEADHRFHDHATARMHAEWAYKAIRLEHDPMLARRLYREAYRLESAKYIKPRMIR